MAKRRGKNESTLLQRPIGRWRAQVCIDGSRASFTANSKTECQAWLRKMLDQAGQAQPIDQTIAAALGNTA